MSRFYELSDIEEESDINETEEEVSDIDETDIEETEEEVSDIEEETDDDDESDIDDEINKILNYKKKKDKKRYIGNYSHDYYLKYKDRYIKNARELYWLNEYKKKKDGLMNLGIDKEEFFRLKNIMYKISKL